MTGTAVKLIASSRFDQEPQYSPDGNRIVFVSYRSGASEIWTCDSDGSNPVQLTSLGATTSPRWAPDGKSIAFSSDAEGHFAAYVVDAEGGAPRRLTSDPSMEYMPSWSRNGEWIYFTSNRNGNFQNFKMPAGGGPAQVVAAGRFPRMESPDGQWFYFVRGANHSVWRMPVEGVPVRVFNREPGEAVASAEPEVESKPDRLMCPTDQHAPMTEEEREDRDDRDVRDALSIHLPSRPDEAPGQGHADRERWQSKQNIEENRTHRCPQIGRPKKRSSSGRMISRPRALLVSSTYPRFSSTP